MKTNPPYGIAWKRIALLAGTAWCCATPLKAGPPAIASLQTDMRAGQYDRVIAEADRLIAAKDKAADEAAYWKALALFDTKRYAECVVAAGRVAAEFPQSDWRFKSVFLTAQALVEQKKFQEASAIYERESMRILAPERKQQLVGAIVKFAEKLSAAPDPNVPDAPRPDFQKAYGLYGKALGMEISREFRDDLMFRKARAIQQAGNAAQAGLDFQAYLTEYDPSWTGPAGSGNARLPMQNPPPAGKHVAMARYRLAESALQAGQPARARWELEDLLKLVTSPAGALAAEMATEEGKRLPADIRWLTVQSYVTPRPELTVAHNSAAVIGNTGGLPVADGILYVVAGDETEQAVKACREFLAACPEGSRAVRAAWIIAEAYAAAGRGEDAIPAYRDFIAGKGFRLPAGEAANKADEEIRATPAEHSLNLKMRALFRIGQILAGQKKREEAVAVWQSYIKEHPNGPQWSDCQNAIIDAEFQMGVDALADKDEALAMRRFDDFLRAHPLDPRSPKILYIYGAIHEAAAVAKEEAHGAPDEIAADYRKAIGEWEKLVSKYPRSAEAKTALMKSGGFFEEKLGEFEKALKLYQKLAGEFGVRQAREHIARLIGKSLTLTAERTFRTNEKAVVKCKSRNIEKCQVRLFKIDLQAYFRKIHGLTGVEGLDVSLIQPDKAWEWKPEGYAKYKPSEKDIEIPFPGNSPGAYVVTVGDDDWESTVLVLRSDLEVIVKSSRREVLAFAQDMLTGAPAEGAEVLVSDGGAVAATGKTGADGVFKTTLESLKSLDNVRVFASRKGHAASYHLDLAGLEMSSGLTAKGYIYTDRPAYLPGETVALRGILRDVRGGVYTVPENGGFVVRVTDPQGRVLSEQAVKLGKFGTFDSSLPLPATAGIGKYVITAVQERKGMEPLAFNGTFEVSRFELEKIKLSMDFPRHVYFRGETIGCVLNAAYYGGEPLPKRPIRCQLPDGRTQTVTTDAEGNAKLDFDTTGMAPGTPLSFVARLDGDNLTTADVVTLTRFGFSIEAKPSQPVVIAGEPFDVEFTTLGADGKPAGEALKVTVLREEKAKHGGILSLLPWMAGNEAAQQSWNNNGVLSQLSEVQVAEEQAKTDAESGNARVSLKPDKGGRYRIRASGTDRAGQIITGECTVEISDDGDVAKLRIFADNATLKVGEDAKVRLHSRMDKGIALLTYEGETILRYQIVRLGKGYNDLSVKVGHDLFPNFRLAAAAMDGRDLRLAEKEFQVERELKVVVKPAKEAFLPGEEGKVEIMATDQTGRPVEAELSLALVNEALFAVYGEATPPILGFFQKDAHRHAGFKAGATCGFQYLGTTRRVAPELVAEADRLARDKRERAEGAALRKDLEQAAAMNAPAPAAPHGALDENGSSAAPDDSGSYAGSTTVSGGTLSRFGRRQIAQKAGAGGGNARDGAMFDQPGSGGFGVSGMSMLFGKEVAEPQAPRHEVRGEGRWLASVVTGADGKAVAAIHMPETATAWRITARGCTVETLVGQASVQTLTRKDFSVELKTPAFLREGDEIRVVGRVHNLTGYAGPVKLTLRALDAKDRTKVLAEREKTVEVKAKAGAEVAFDGIVVPNALELAFELGGAAGDNRDALARTIPVKPWGLQYEARAGGTAVADTAAVLGLPGVRPYSSTWMAVSVGPDIRTSVLDMALRQALDGPCAGIARIHPAPWGAHAGDELLSVASALAYANTGKVDETYLRRLSGRAHGLVANLVSSQAADGSWAGRASGHLTTCRVFWALVAARQAGIAVDKATLDKAAGYLRKQFEQCDAGDADSKSAILHALSCDKRADFANCNRIYRERNALGNGTLAYLALAFANLDRKEIAAELAGILEAQAKIGSQQPVCWESGYKTVWLNDTDETTALVLLALSGSKPESKAGESASRYLLQAHGCFGYATSRAAGPAVAALAAWFGHAKEAATEMEIGIVVNGREVGKVKATGCQSTTWVDVPREVVKTDKNLVEFKMSGRGRYAYTATLCGFSPDTKPTGINVTPVMEQVRHIHAQLEYRGKVIGAGSSSPVKNLENGQRMTVNLSTQNGWGWPHEGRRYALEIPLPPGARLTEGSLSPNPSNWITGTETTDSSVIVYFDHWLQSVSYEVTGYAPGRFRLLPPVIRELGNSAFLTIGPATELTVLAAGEKSPDAYEMNDGERYALGKCAFDDGDLAGALGHLSVVFRDNPKYNESELTRMLLWIYATPRFHDARKIVEMFEILRERYPTLEIPFDRMLVVARAYRDIGEHERSWLVCRAVIAASFSNDSAISAVLEDEGRFLGSIDFQERVWREYPDTAEVVSSYFALSQLLYQKAPNAHELPKEDNIQPEKPRMLKCTADMLLAFLAMYPKDPLADNAGFSLCNCMLDLKDYPLVVSLGRDFAKRYADSPLAPGFQYMTALGLFWQSQYGEALAAAKIVADGDSKDRDYARYILGQIYHAQNKPADAIGWYGKVKQLYPDAADAIAYFEEKRILLEEVTLAKPGEAVNLTLKYRNLKEAFVQVYRVDLMKLYLQQKNLSKITSVQLAGIRPEVEETIALGDGKDYAEKERKVALKLKDEAAYLVICRGDDLFASGMVLITPLKIEVQEDTASGTVRANVLDTVKGGYRPGVHVKAIGSEDSDFHGGETDLRGLFVADNLRGKVTVIAREGESRYAFFRGDKWLGAAPNLPVPAAAQPAIKQQIDYQNNLNFQNGTIQEINNGKFNELRRQKQNKGVEAQKAY